MERLESELGWAAGIVDGEGHIGLRRTSPGYRQVVSFCALVMVANTNAAIIQRFGQIVGGGIIIKKASQNRRKWKPCFVWTANGRHAAHVCQLLLPYLVKHEQAQLVCEAVTLVLPPSGNKGRRNPNLAQLQRLYDRLRVLNRRGPREDDLVTSPPEHDLPQIDLLFRGK